MTIMYVPYMKKYEELQYLDKLLPYLELYLILVVEARDIL